MLSSLTKELLVMKDLTKKQIILMIIIIGIIFCVGLLCGIFIGISIEKREHNETTSNIDDKSDQKKENHNVANATIDSHTENQTQKSKNKLSENELKQLKAKIEKDEADYGDNYQKFMDSAYASNYKRTPDRIYFKSGLEDGFYVYEANDENYGHLLEVVEDRMSYTVMEDYNLYAFTPDSIQTMLTSKDNYIIFDYDNGTLTKQDNNFQKDIIFRFSENTRLYRLVTYLSHNKELITKENLGKK